MRLTKLGVIVSALATPALGFAQAEPPQDGWHFEATPYLWAAGLSGWTRVGARTPTAKFDANFSDVWRNLDFGAMGAFEARKGRWAILFDAIYVKLSKTSDPLLGGALGTARLKGDQTILQLAGAYRVLDSPVIPVDVLAGVRYTNLYSQPSFSQSALLPNGPSASDSVSWTDGFAGVRAAYILSDKWSLFAYGDGGGGGTKYSWQVITGANYNVSKTFVAKVGYRIISMDYETNNFLYNVRTSGVFAGLGIRF
jgi:hypothetical protein